MLMTPESERHLLWLVMIVAAAIVIVIQFVAGPMNLFKLAICAVALVVMGFGFFKRSRNRYHRRT
jgi:hypothetical protein